MWLTVEIAPGGPSGIRLRPGVQAGTWVGRGEPLVECFDRFAGIVVTMGLGRCKEGKAPGSVWCALPDGRDYLDPMEPRWWLGGAPRFMSRAEGGDWPAG